MIEVVFTLGLCLAAFAFVGIALLALEWIAFLLIWVGDAWRERKKQC